MNNLSRNKPLAFVVGAAGFIGSHLVEELLAKKIQVVGVDNLSTGFRDNLTDSAKEKYFELISQDMDSISNLSLPRLDYAIFIITESGNNFRFQQSFKSFLNLCKPFNTKIILCSTIDLYDSEKNIDQNLKNAETYLAKEALNQKINARIVRLAAVFGPRMHFRIKDPIIRLIKSAISDKLNNEATPLEFTTRALYIKDAIRLLIKAIMHGSTSQKIYDGALISPIKISEIKQVLLDPVWYEEKGFSPTALPPWPTPNLNKTCKELSWKPDADIVTALKDTLTFFKSHKDKASLIDSKELSEVKETEGEAKEEPEKERSASEDKNKIIYNFPKINFKKIKTNIFVLIGLAIIFLAVFFPFIKFGFAVYLTKNHLENSINLLTSGDFDKAETQSKAAMVEMASLNSSIEKAAFIKRVDILKQPYETSEQILKIGNKLVKANYHTIAGAKSLASGLFVVSGEKEGDSQKYFSDAKTELETADSELGEVSANINDGVFLNNLPGSLKNIFDDLGNKNNTYRDTINLGKALADLLPEIIAADGQKNYLVVLQDNRILRPGGGVLRAYAEVTFDHGRLLKIKSDSIENLDRQFKDLINPPIELKNDLGETNWRLRDGSYDLDFPTSARNISWFFNKESGDQVSGVIALDLTAASNLLQATGASGKNINFNISLDREGNPIAASALKNLVERIFFLSKQNWIKFAQNSDESLSQKHLLIYLADPVSFSYLSSNGWTGVFPLQKKEKIGEEDDFLAFCETNASLGQDSSAVDKTAKLETRIDLSGIISHKLTINFTATEKLSGKYRNRFKVYLPANSKFTKATWGSNQLKDINPFSDYGRAGLSMLLEINTQEQKELVLEYQNTAPVSFKDNQLKYYLNVFKQPSQQGIPFEFKITFPPEYKAKTDMQTRSGEISAKTDLSKDKLFSIIFNK